MRNFGSSNSPFLCQSRTPLKISKIMLVYITLQALVILASYENHFVLFVQEV